MTEAAALLKAGTLAQARSRLVEEIKRAPTDVGKRLALAEMLILLGEWERADTHLDLVSTQDPSWTPMTALLRQLIRASAHRDDVFSRGRPPELVTDPTPRTATALRILAEHRSGGDAGALRAEADERFAPVALEVDGETVQGVRDLDDRTADILEVLTTTGRYVWLSFDQVASLSLSPAEHPRDRVWRAAELEVFDGPAGVVYLPMLYPAPAAEPRSDAQRTGLESDWTEAGGLTIGLGQKCWLLGDDLKAASEVGSLQSVRT